MRHGFLYSCLSRCSVTTWAWPVLNFTIYACVTLTSTYYYFFLGLNNDTSISKTKSCNRGTKVWVIATKTRVLVREWMTMLTSLLTKKRKNTKSKAKTLELIHKESSFQKILEDFPVIVSMYTLASLSTAMSWKFSNLAILMSNGRSFSNARVKKGRPFGTLHLLRW